MIISPFTPIFFHPISRESESDGIASPYVQTFSQSDNILIEVICTEGDGYPNLDLQTESNGSLDFLDMKEWEMADGNRLYFAELSGLSPGAYRIAFRNQRLISHWFRVTEDNDELSKTVLIQYSMKDNKQRKDGVFMIGGMRRFFDFRVPGGFKDSEITFGVDAEQFTTQQGDICTLYALESTTRRFTLGAAEGVPAHFAELLNRILCCTYVYFDGVRYARKDASVPEMNVQIEGVDSFVFKQNLQKVANIDPAIEDVNMRLIMRSWGEDGIRDVTRNIGEEIKKRKI